ncbi:hypothetical protein F4861DRAFT_512289 [Xylaria intraflava]|nr:hypothetical protein F4861DRAFT_512289 [Xylaria intraflava]
MATSLPLCLRNPCDELYQKSSALAGNRLSKRSLGNSEIKTSRPSIVNTADTSSQTHHKSHQNHHASSQQEQSPTQNSSKIPVEWLDCILETSFTTRNPELPSLCVSQVTMEFLRQNKTCIYVEFPRLRGVPEPLQCYPGFKAALEDICDQFGHFYAPFAAYNAHTRMITLYASDMKRPTDKFVDKDTALFDLHRARSEWVPARVAQASSTDVTHDNETHENASAETPVTPTKDSSLAMADLEEIPQPHTPENQKIAEIPKTPAAPRA